MTTLATQARLSLKNILFATDFSACSETALIYAKAIGRRYGAKIYIGHVIAPEPSYEVPLDPLPLEFSHHWDAARRNMSTFLEVHDLKDLPHERLLRAGQFWTVLQAMIEENHIDLLVAGTHGREGLKKLLLGSVSEEIFRRASCPVLTVGPDVVDGAARVGEFHQVLYATDFSPESAMALPFALSLAEENRARLLMVHAVHDVPAMLEATEYPEARLATARQRLVDMLPRDLDLWCAPEMRVEVGTPAEYILQSARDAKADIIVMGVRHQKSAHAAAHIPWRTAHQVVCHARCPVLTVRG